MIQNQRLGRNWLETEKGKTVRQLVQETLVWQEILIKSLCEGP